MALQEVEEVLKNEYQARRNNLQIALQGYIALPLL